MQTKRDSPLQHVGYISFPQREACRAIHYLLWQWMAFFTRSNAKPKEASYARLHHLGGSGRPITALSGNCVGSLMVKLSVMGGNYETAGKFEDALLSLPAEWEVEMIDV